MPALNHPLVFGVRFQSSVVFSFTAVFDKLIDCRQIYRSRRTLNGSCNKKENGTMTVLYEATAWSAGT